MELLPQIQVLCKVLIFILLCIGAYSDLKTRTVSNAITGSIGLLSLPVIYNRSNAFNWVTYSFVALFLVLYLTKSMGGADVKVLIPLMFIVPNALDFMLVLSLLGIVFAVISWSTEIPYFVPIAMAYGVFFGSIGT